MLLPDALSHMCSYVLLLMRAGYAILSVVEDGLHPTSQGVGECSSPLPIVMVGDMPEMPQVKWNILVVLCD